MEPVMVRGYSLTLHNRFRLTDYAILLFSVAVVYGRLIGADFQAAWDDNIYILNNETVRGFSWEHIRSAFIIGNGAIGQYNPLALLSFMLDHAFWGFYPGGYHLTNIIIHALNGLLVYRLISRFHGDRLVSLIAAAIFLLHPVQVESVAWISERKGLLSLFFLLISWELYLRYHEEEVGRRKIAYAGSLLSFVLALLAKTSSVVLPIILLLHEWCFSSKGRRVCFKDKVPFFIVTIIFSAIEVYSEKPANGGASVGYHGGSPLATFFTMMPVFCRYLRLLLWPSGLNVEHWPPIHSTVDAAVIGALLLLAGVIVSGIILFRRDRKLGFWVLFFWVGLFPVSQIVPLFLLMYEHYLYMPLIGFATLVGSGSAILRDRFGRQRSILLYLVLGFFLLALSVVSFNRTAVWQDSLALFTDASAKSPNDFRVWEVLGGINFKNGQIDAARKAYDRSLTLKPDNTDVLWALGELHTKSGELDKGYDYLQRVLKIDSIYVKAWATLGTNYRDRGDYAAAEKAYLHAQELQPDAIQVVQLLGNLALIQGRLEQARVFYGQVETKMPNDSDNAYHMACVESLAGHKAVALDWLEKAFKRGYRDYDKINTDKKLSAIWDEPRFNTLLMMYFPELER